mmetsp:Transcript_95183/g.252805  ORF Transcript_95183/g.252805 Transcript_95183/m.252805 type:complete len:213 (+) Transcript_95183:681-1319(+)
MAGVTFRREVSSAAARFLGSSGRALSFALAAGAPGRRVCSMVWLTRALPLLSRISMETRSSPESCSSSGGAMRFTGKAGRARSTAGLPPARLAQKLSLATAEGEVTSRTKAPSSAAVEEKQVPSQMSQEPPVPTAVPVMRPARGCDLFMTCTRAATLKETLSPLFRPPLRCAAKDMFTEVPQLMVQSLDPPASSLVQPPVLWKVMLLPSSCA